MESFYPYMQAQTAKVCRFYRNLRRSVKATKGHTMSEARKNKVLKKIDRGMDKHHCGDGEMN